MRTCPGCFELRANSDYCYVTPGGDQAWKQSRKHQPKKRCQFCFANSDSAMDRVNNHWVRMNHLGKSYGLHLEALGEMWRRQGRACVYCKTPINLRLKRHYEIDHKLPKSRGGKESLENLQILCCACNQAKRAQTHEEFVAWIRRVASFLPD